MLKRAGLISYSTFDGLSAGQRSHVTRLATQYSEVLKRPSNFVVRKVTNSKTVKSLKASGIPVVNGRAIVKADFDTRVRITAKSIVIEGPYDKQTTYLTAGRDFLDEVDEFGQGAGIFARPIRHNRQVWSFTIAGKLGHRAPYFEDFEELIDYLENRYKAEVGELINPVFIDAKRDMLPAGGAAADAERMAERAARIKAGADNTKFRR